MDDTPSELGTRPSLLAGLRDADNAGAWETFVRTYAPLVYGYCRRRGAQDADAADVTQDVLTHVARAMRSFEYQPLRGRFRDWLGTVTRHALARYLQRQRRAVNAAGGDAAAVAFAQLPDPAPDAEWTAEFNAALLAAAFERIRPVFEAITWQAFTRVWQDHQPAAAVARDLNMPIEKVYGARWRVLKRLRAEVLLLAEDYPLLVSLDG